MSDGKIILVRHGETEANRAGCFAASDDIKLTGMGHDQAHQLALTIQNQFNPTRLFSSSFKRARQTAAIIARQLRLPVEVLDGVQERNFGCLKGQRYCHMGEMMKADSNYDTRRRWMWIPEEGESLEQVQIRAVGALASVAELYPEEEIVIVSHGAVMETIAAHLANNWDTACVPPNCGMLIVGCSALPSSFRS